MKTKLRQVKGETLVETLAALAIVVMAIFLLTNMLTVAARLNHKSASLADSYQREIAMVEGGWDFVGSDNSDDADDSGSVKFTDPDGLFADVDGSDTFVAEVQKNIESQKGRVQISWQEVGASNPTQIQVIVKFIGSNNGSLAYYQAPVEDGGDSDD